MSEPISSTFPPKHPFEVNIRIGGDTWEYILRTVRELSYHLEEHGPDCRLCSGGAGGCHSVDIQRRDISPEDYRKELQESHELSLSSKAEEGYQLAPSVCDNLR